jgi:hypothetical protein
MKGNDKCQSSKEYGIVEEWNSGMMGIFRNIFPFI